MEIWQSERLKKISWVVHGTASRNFGSTRYPNAGEGQDATEENRAAFLLTLGLNAAQLVVSGNEHGNHIVSVDGKSPRRVGHCDGLITGVSNVPLATKTADCLPLFFVDPTVRTVAVAHAGWKGVASGMAIEAVRAFFGHGSRPSDLVVAIGPSIGPCHYVVHDERRDQMLERTPFIEPSDFHAGHVDLRAIVTRQLSASGILPANIDLSAPCTACHPDLFFSYALSRDSSEGMLSVISKV